MNRNQEQQEKKIEALLSLVDHRVKTKFKIDLLNSIEIINGYDLVFIFSLIMRNNYSGNLTIVNEENLMSGISFIYGDIVKVDYPDHEHMLGNLIVDNEIISKFEMQDIVEKSEGKRLGDYLIENGILTAAQLRKLLFKQTKLRLDKYMSSMGVRLKFSFDGQSSDNVLISKIDFNDILHSWIFTQFKDEWLVDYGNYYQKKTYSAEVSPTNLNEWREYTDVFQALFKISQFKKNTQVTYTEIFRSVYQSKQMVIKLVHFMMLTGMIFIYKPSRLEQLTAPKDDRRRELAETLDEDLRRVQKDLLDKNYFRAFGLLNKYSLFNNEHPTVTFYFIWIKLIGAYYYNHLADFNKVEAEFNALDYFRVNPGEFFYVKALLRCAQKREKDCDDAYSKAIYHNLNFKDYPIKKPGGFFDRIINFITNSR